MARPELVARFQTEARAAGQLVHPNIVIVYDAGEADGLYYITMEFVEGRSLQALIDQKQPFPLPRIMRIMGQVCSALDFAHQRNVVHRDVKPANIVLCADDTVKVTDFGTAKILQLGTTQSGTIVGTPSYMSPEQIKGKPIDGRADVFSLGVILYELVTGEKPFPGESVTTVIYKIVNEEPIPPRELDSSVHPGLSAVITKALCKDPDGRYQNCKEVMQDLLNYRALGGAAPADYGATVVVVGRPGPLPSAPPPEPAPSKTGTLPGAPTLSPPPGAMKPIPPPVAKPDPALQTAGGIRPLPGASSLPSLTSSGSEGPNMEGPAPRGRPMLVFMLIVLLGVGGYLIWPTLRDLVFHKDPEVVFVYTKPASPSKGPETPAAKSAEGTSNEAPAKETHAAPANVTKTVAPPPAKGTSAPTKPAPRDLIPKIERQLSRAGIASRVKVELRDNVVRFTGSPTPNDRKKLQQMGQRWAVPAGFSVEYAFETMAESSPEVKVKTAPGRGEIEVLTDVNGADAVLTAPDRSTDRCRTPCRFDDLLPGRYELSVTKDGYRTEHRVIPLTKGNIKSINIPMQAGTAQLEVISRPPGAEILINGQRQGRQTPATIPVSPGSYRIGLQKPGYALYEESVKIGADELKKMNVPLAEQQKGVGWIDVKSIPSGADILVNGSNTGQKTPARIELPAGQYTLMLYLAPNPVVRETVTVQSGQTLQVYKNLAP
jgi:serine/threonine-protein kinase